MEHTKPSPFILAPVDTTIHEAQNEGITQSQETEHIRLEEEIRRGNLRLQELEKDQVWLREKSDLMDAEVKKLENQIKQEFLVEKLRLVRQGAYDHVDKLEDYCLKLVSLLPWLGPHIAKCNDRGSAL